MKHVKKFGSFVNESAKEPDLTSGEKAALTKGLDLLTDAQAAVCYLYAKGLSHKLYSTSSRGYVISDTISSTQQLDIADSMGLKGGSFMYAVRKFRILLGKDEQGDEAIYPKITKLFDHFEDMTTDQVVELGKTAFTEDAKARGEEYKQQRLDKQVNTKKTDAERSRNVNSVYPQFFKHFSKTMSPAEAKEKAIATTMKNLELTKKQVLDIVNS